MTALALFSGGCDSLISMKLLTMQNIRVIALHFNIGFGGNKDKLEYFQNAAKQVGAELMICDIREQFFDNVLFAPKYGYGKYFNPCIDCHANMFANAFYKLLELGADFVISGEVLGQRPKSQRKEALDQVRKLVREVGADKRFEAILDPSGSDPSKPRYLDELLLRPMSAKLLEESFPEKMGWVDREGLLDVNGRARDRQLEMVKKWGWKYYENPGGGCLLTDINVANKLKDLSAHRKMVLEDTTLVKIGRYMVLPNGARCVIGRNQEENDKLKAPNPQMEIIELLEDIGPIGVVEKDASQADKILAARITLGYGKAGYGKVGHEKAGAVNMAAVGANMATTASASARKVQVGAEVLEVSPLPREQAREYLLFKD